MDPIITVNLVLCVAILFLGLLGWRRSGKMFPMSIGIAFGLFGVSHVVTLLGKSSALETEMIIVRTLAYVIVVAVLFLVAFEKK